MIKKQKTMIIAIACVLVVLAVGYAVLANTLLKPDDSSAPEENLALYDKIERSKVAKIQVKNEKGSFVLYQGTDGEMYFEGAESQIYDSYLLSSLISAAGNPVATQSVKNYSAEDLSIYGLQDGSFKATFTITTNEATPVSHTVRIGNALVNGAGFYAMLDGTDALYVLSNFYSTSLFADVRDYFAPQVAIPAVTEDGNAATLESYSVYQNGDLILTILPSHVDEEGEALVTETLYAYKVSYPEERWVSNSAFGSVLQGLQNFAGVRVAEFGINPKVTALQEYLNSSDTAIDPEQGKLAYEAMELMKKYGLLNDEYQFPYVLDYACEGVKSYVIVSTPDEEGKFYVYSQAFDLIAEFEMTGFEWIFWDAEKYSVRSLFNHSVYDLTKVEIVAPTVNASFELTVNKEKTDVTKVIETGTGKEVSVDLFKQMYRGFLYFNNVGTAQMPEGAQPSLTVRISVADGSQTEFVFYDLTDRKSFYTVNGKGEYFVNRDNVKALIVYAQNVLEGKSFTSSLL